MKLRELLKNIDILDAAPGLDMDTEICGMSYDSRLTKPGDLFVAIPGLTVDGHKFIPKAMERGAAAVLCQQPHAGCPYVQVADCRLALALCSAAFYGRPADKMKMIGITGTSGKTSTTLLLKQVLESCQGAKVGLIGTNGNMIGQRSIHTEFTTPESLELHGLFRQMLDAGCTHVVMEVSSHSLTMERVAGINFDVALFTNLSQDHLDLHGTMEEYALAKAKIFSQAKEGWADLDDARAPLMLERARCPMKGFSAENSSAELYADDLELNAGGACFTAHAGKDSARVELKIPGLFSVYNGLAVLAVCQSLGIELSQAAQALSMAEGVKGRMEPVKTDDDYSIVIDYSHKPDALEKALKTLRPLTKGRLIVVFGCGGDRDKLKRPIMGRIAAQNADLVVVTSDNPRTEDPMDIIDQIVPGLVEGSAASQVICDRREAIAWAIDKAQAGDVILLAGKGHEDYQVVGHERLHMDEREIIAQVLSERNTARLKG